MRTFKQQINDLDLNIVDYTKGVSKIESFFDKTYGHEPKDWLYRQVKYLRDDEWEYMCENAAGRFDRFPTIGQIISVFAHKLREAKKRRIDAISAISKELGVAQCDWCNHTGIINARHKTNKVLGMFSFRCHNCDFANLQDLSKEIEPWLSSFGSQLEVINKTPLTEEEIKYRNIIRSEGIDGLLKQFKLLSPEPYRKIIKS